MYGNIGGLARSPNSEQSALSCPLTEIPIVCVVILVNGHDKHLFLPEYIWTIRPASCDQVLLPRDMMI